MPTPIPLPCTNQKSEIYPTSQEIVNLLILFQNFQSMSGLQIMQVMMPDILFSYSKCVLACIQEIYMDLQRKEDLIHSGRILQILEATTHWI